MRRRSVTVLAALLIAPLAHAQDAATLFQEGLAAFDRGDTAVACGKFEQSYKLDAATGTLFNLATCHAKEGHFWQARAEFLKLAREMDRAGEADKAKIAREQATVAEAHVPRLSFSFPVGSNVKAIELDGDEVDASKWHAPVPVAPGSHVVVFSADGTVSETRTVEAQGEGATVALDVPLLVAGAARKPNEPTATGQRGGGLPDRGVSGTADGWTGRQTTGAVIGGVGIVAIGVGGYFGLHALSQKSDANDACGGSGGACVDAAHARAASDQIHTAQDTARMSTITIAGGLVAVAVGGYLFFTGNGGSGASASTGVRVAPAIAHNGGSIAVGGRF